MKKIFLCEWGDWDESAMNSYQPKKEEVGIDFFGDHNGYEEEELEAVEALNIGEKYNVTYGNHTVLRLK